MSSEVVFAARLLNGLVTLSCGLYLLRYFLRKESRTYSIGSWMLGLLLWGVSILLRLKLDNSDIVLLQLNLLIGFFFIVGTSTFLHPSQKLILVYVPILLLAFVAYFYFTPSSIFYCILGGVNFFSMGLLTWLFRKKIGDVANWIIVAWILVIFANILPSLALPEYSTDLVSAIGKTAGLYGINKQHYAATLYIYEKKLRQSYKSLSTDSPNRYGDCQKYVQRKWMQESANPIFAKEFRRRFIQSFLDVIILTILLQKGPMTGYGIINAIKEKFEAVPGPGSLYPVLNRMEKRELIRSISIERRKEWLITSKGEKWYREMLLEQKKVIGMIISLLEAERQHL